MKFLIDAQLPPALAKFLISHGHTAEHVIGVGLRDADDESIWNYAIRTGSVIITKDEDFAARLVLSPDRPGVIWLRAGNCSNRALLQWFAQLLPDVLHRLERGEKLIEIV